MQAPAGAPDWLEVVTAAERPDLWERARDDDIFRDVWPEYEHHGSNGWKFLPSVYPAHAQFQILFLDRRTERLIARGETIGLRWDGSLRDLPAGFDAVGLRGITDPMTPTAVSALAAEVDNEYQDQGLSTLLIKAMAIATKAAGLAYLLVPLRPSWKERYPLVSIERYAAWRRDDGLPFDPWMRVHLRIGGRILRPAPRSIKFHAPVADWERWTGIAFPDDGQYVFPRGLAPLTVRRGFGTYWEPNVWILHETSQVEVAHTTPAPGAIAKRGTRWRDSRIVWRARRLLARRLGR
jgi:hypothetical protein